MHNSSKKGVTLDDALRWAKRMERIFIKENRVARMSTYNERIRRYCPLGVEHFCDGRPNGCKGKKRRPCIMYINGRCTNQNVRIRNGQQ